MVIAKPVSSCYFITHKYHTASFGFSQPMNQQSVLIKNGTVVNGFD
jgi:hypothetical protein